MCAQSTIPSPRNSNIKRESQRYISDVRWNTTGLVFLPLHIKQGSVAHRPYMFKGRDDSERLGCVGLAQEVDRVDM